MQLRREAIHVLQHCQCVHNFDRAREQLDLLQWKAKAQTEIEATTSRAAQKIMEELPTDEQGIYIYNFAGVYIVMHVL